MQSTELFTVLPMSRTTLIYIFLAILCDNSCIIIQRPWEYDYTTGRQKYPPPQCIHVTNARFCFLLTTVFSHLPPISPVCFYVGFFLPPSVISSILPVGVITSSCNVCQTCCCSHHLSGKAAPKGTQPSVGMQAGIHSGTLWTRAWHLIRTCLFFCLFLNRYV